MKYCRKCKKGMYEDPGYKSIARCKNQDCENYNIPIRVLVL